jgi:hypothetical protein
MSVGSGSGRHGHRESRRINHPAELLEGETVLNRKDNSRLGRPLRSYSPWVRSPIAA